MPSPLFAFFSQFADFEYTQHSHPSDAFNDLVDVDDIWRPIYETKYLLVEAYRDALTQEFNELFGTEVDDLTLWQNLCRRIGLDVPTTMKKCRQVHYQYDFLYPSPLMRLHSAHC